jgi:transcriptional regulator NrdR family protein
VNCPSCNSKTKVIESRIAGKRTVVSKGHEYSGPKIRRRHRCDKCNTRFSTIEIICEKIPPKQNINRKRKEKTTGPSDWLERIKRKLEE